MQIRPFNHDADFPLMDKWIAGHKAIPMPHYVFPQGWIVGDGTVDIAMSFLYMDVGGRFAVIEFLTTNPQVAMSKSLVLGVKTLVSHIERVAIDQGCRFIISFVAPGTGEEHLMAKLGYETSPGPSHRLYAKPLTLAPPCP